MLGLVVTNLARHKARTIATAVGIALGVATIVALLSIGSGLQRTAAGLVHLGDADLGLFQSGVEDPTASVLPASLAQRLERRPDVAKATPLLLVVEGVRQDPAAIVFGADPKGFIVQRLVVSRGSPTLGAKQVLVGDRLARELKLRARLDADRQAQAVHRRRDLPLGRLLRGLGRGARPRRGAAP